MALNGEQLAVITFKFINTYLNNLAKLTNVDWLFFAFNTIPYGSFPEA